MITVLDTDGTIRYLSPSIERILGYKPALRLSHEREKLLNQINRALNTCLEPNYILQEIVKLTGECFGVDRVLVYRLETENIQVLKEWRSCEQVISIIGFKLPLEETLQSLQN